MAENMKIEIVSKETIKPSSPTPKHLKHYKLSLLDQLFPPSIYVSLVLFYPKNNDFPTNQTLLHRIKNSLSETLTRFYPLAGRIKGNISIDCGDYGAQFIEAQIHGFLSTFLENLEKHSNLPLPFLPPKSELFKPISPPLLVVQVTSFNCRGVAIALCMSHKFGDGATLRRFIKDWSSISHGQSKTLPPPLDFKASSHFPPSINAVELPPNMSKRLAVTADNRITKRFVFDAWKIDDLKAKIAAGVNDESLRQKPPTRTEVVTALIWRCSMKASRSNKGFSMHSLLHQMVNFRKRVEPPLLEDSMGNYVQHFSSQAEEGKIELTDLVCMLRKGIEEFCVEEAKRLGGDDWMEEIFRSWKERKDISIRDDTNLYTCTSMCCFGFHEIDFGWGKPIWLTIDSGNSLNNFILLTSTRDGDGVEASVTLREEDMVLFELDNELLSSAYPSNPFKLC